MQIRAVLFDFGGVIAEEGFREGLYAIAERFGLDRKLFFQLANEAVYNSGYVTGTGTEKDFWNMVRNHSGIVADDKDLRQEILSKITAHFLKRIFVMIYYKRNFSGKADF